MTRGQGVGEGREVWFRWVLWFRWPVHWKGWATILIWFFSMLALVRLFDWSAEQQLSGWTNYVLVLSFIAVFVSYFVVIARHTGPRR